MKPWQHFKTITYHRYLVMCGCFRVGLYRQGIMHDLSKYSPSEFCVGIRYWTGKRSPNAGERQALGYSTAWMHHKGRNRHHWEYWTDLDKDKGVYAPVPMPRKFLVEMVMDRRAACMTYEGENYSAGSELRYLEKSIEKELLHPQTLRELTHILTMLRDEGEKATFKYLKTEVLKGKPFPWE